MNPRFDTINVMVLVIRRDLANVMLSYPNPIHEEQMKRTKFMTIPYSPSKIPSAMMMVKRDTNRVGRRNLLNIRST